MSFKQFFETYIIQEAHVLKFSTKGNYIYPDEQIVLKDDMTIRVYHAFHDMIDCIRTLKYGISGKERIGRRYSYENNNNPKGLFVTINPHIAKDFGNYIIEFHSKVSDLEAPVWPGGSYTVQGQMEQYFKDEKEREEQRLKTREHDSKNKYDAISKSDRPELAYLLYNSMEQQALFTGELNSNSVRAVWINKTPEKSGKYSEYERLAPMQFIIQYGDQDKIMKRDWQSGEYKQHEDDTDLKARVFKPREKFDLDTFITRIQADHNDLDREYLLGVFRDMNDGYLLHYVWPNQLNALKKALTNTNG